MQLLSASLMPFNPDMWNVGVTAMSGSRGCEQPAMFACQAASGSVQVIAARPNVCKQLHMPAQSGSTSTLQRMRRGYTRQAYDALVRHAREMVPNVALSSDIITGRSRHLGSQTRQKLLHMCQRCMWCLLSAPDLTTASAGGMCVQQQAQRDPYVCPAHVSSSRLSWTPVVSSRTLWCTGWR